MKHLVSYSRSYGDDDTTVKLHVSRRGFPDVEPMIDDKEFPTLKDARQFAYERGYLRRYIPKSDPLDPNDESKVLWP